VSRLVPSAALPIARVVLQILVILNWLSGALLVILLVAMPTRRWIMNALDLPQGPEADQIIWGLRGIAVVALAAIPLHYIILKRLIAIVETVRAGDPFVAVNAARLSTIAWTLLTLQCMGIAITVIDAGASNQDRLRVFHQRLARCAAHVRARTGVRRGDAHARRPRRDRLTWRSRSNSTTCCTTSG
jgi:hypothetical protein